MATGDPDDMLRRLKATLPYHWWQDVAPYRDAVLGSLADLLAWAYDLLMWVKAQTRVGTATGFSLDLAAYDFLGLRFRRRLAEVDDSFRARVLAEILRPRNTRAAITSAVTDLTGSTPILFEPANPTDCGGWGMPCMGYGVAGRYGTLSLPAQVFVTAVRPAGQGVPDVAGYGSVAGGWNAGSIEWVASRQIVAPVTDADIYDTVAQTKAAGVVAWAGIRSAAFPAHTSELQIPLTRQ